MAEGEILIDKDLKSLFESASSYVKSIVSKLTSQQLFEFYGFYKQATEGPCCKPKPSWYEFNEKPKWEAWSALKDMDPNKAMNNYVALLSNIEPRWEEEKPEDTSNGWVHHSCMRNDDENIEDSNKTIFDWVKENNLDKVKTSDMISEVNKLDDSGMSLLHWAADRGSLDIVKYFVENLGADVNVRDANGQTPLHYAVCCEYENVAKYLIDAGADAQIKDNDGQTPYEAAM